MDSSDEGNMTTDKALEIIIEALEKTVGKDKARRALSVTMSCLLYDIEESGQALTAENINRALIDEAKFCAECMEKDAA